MDELRVAEKFYSRIQFLPNDCWQWMGVINKWGYGQFSMKVGAKWKTLKAHRVSYEKHRGLIPDGLDLDHSCRNRACVNPFHVDPATNRENILRGNTIPAMYARRTHCLRGHSLAGENLGYRIPRYPGGEPTKICRACQKMRDAKWAQTRRERRRCRKS